MTPAPTETTLGEHNDGQLSYNELLQWPLADCELAVLSVCQTNVGPDRPLEAGSTLAQALLAAGAHRVVASHGSDSLAIEHCPHNSKASWNFRGRSHTGDVDSFLRENPSAQTFL